MKRLWLAPVALILAACAVRGADSPWYPLQMGDSWTYKAGDGKFTLKVVDTNAKVDKDTCVKVVMTSDGKELATEHVAVKDDGVYRYSFGDKKADKPVLFFKLPPKKDATWEVDTKALGETIKGTFKIGEVKELKVPAGTYTNVITSSCEDLDAAGIKMNVTFYFAEKVGLIKQVIKYGTTEIVVELEKYEPAKK
jgi:hypothetical protein